MASIDESYTYYDSYNISISTNNLEAIRDGSYIHTDIDTIDARLKICDRIKQAQSEWKVAELSANIMVKGLHKLFKAVVN